MRNYQVCCGAIATALLLVGACAHVSEIPRSEFEPAVRLFEQHCERAPAYIDGPFGDAIADTVVRHLAECKVEAFIEQSGGLPGRGSAVVTSTDVDIVLALDSDGGVASFSAQPIDAETDCVAHRLRGARFAPPPFSPLYIKVGTRAPPWHIAPPAPGGRLTRRCS